MGPPPSRRTPRIRATVKRAPSRTGAAARRALEKGATVQVLAGPFEGKVGVVQEIDGKGTARVVLGTMSSWVPLTDLSEDRPDTRTRPPFRSSHRKPGK
jgi:hypothetical protein